MRCCTGQNIRIWSVCNWLNCILHCDTCCWCRATSICTFRVQLGFLVQFCWFLAVLKEMCFSRTEKSKGRLSKGIFLCKKNHPWNFELHAIFVLFIILKEFHCTSLHLNRISTVFKIYRCFNVNLLHFDCKFIKKLRNYGVELDRGEFLQNYFASHKYTSNLKFCKHLRVP